MSDDWKNKLYFGDNLDILRKYIKDESVDLIYLDPPFNSNATYNVLFQEKSGEKSAAQITAFEDTWHWGQESEFAYQEIVRDSPKKLSDVAQALRMFLGQNDMMAYLTMMAQRLVELHRVLKPTGSIYLHCDSRTSHYLKLLLDASFGIQQFRNDIRWKRQPVRGAKSIAQQFAKTSDSILFYSKTQQTTWNRQFKPYSEDYVKAKFTYQDKNGRSFRIGDIGDYSDKSIEKFRKLGKIYDYPSGKIGLKRYLDEQKGEALGDFWPEPASVNALAAERLGYPTQKPEALLERIIRASCNEGDLVLDPFCGCGTAVAVAERLHRRWIGIDITHLAITLMRHRLTNAFGKDLAPYEIVGQPKDLESAKALALESEHSGRYQFEWWALGLVDARPAQDKKKGSDKGVDGFINFFDDTSGKAKTIIVQVKSGHVNVAHIHALKGVLEREKAPIGVYITLEEPTKPMIEEAAAAGFYEPEHWPGKYYPRVQILTIQQLLDGKTVDYPRYAPVATFKKAPKARKANGEEQNKLL